MAIWPSRGSGADASAAADEEPKEGGVLRGRHVGQGSRDRAPRTESEIANAERQALELRWWKYAREYTFEPYLLSWEINDDACQIHAACAQDCRVEQRRQVHGRRRDQQFHPLGGQDCGGNSMPGRRQPRGREDQKLREGAIEGRRHDGQAEAGQQTSQSSPT